MDSLPPHDREWLVKLIADSETRLTNRMMMLRSEFQNVEARLENVENRFIKEGERVGKKAGTKAGVNAGVLASAAAAIILQIAERWLM